MYNNIDINKHAKNLKQMTSSMFAISKEILRIQKQSSGVL